MEEVECYSCDAVFTVEHCLDENYYDVIYCPFCGTVLADDMKMEWGDYDDE